jgi:hypothetical protein
MGSSSVWVVGGQNIDILAEVRQMPFRYCAQHHQFFCTTPEVHAGIAVHTPS